jgi:V/A-type H+-transporting ATPase subunit E
MSCKELIASLRKAADERVRALWSDAEDEAGKIRANAEERLVQLRQDLDRKQLLLAGERSARAEADAQKRSRIISLSAERRLSERLYAEALSMLETLREQGYESFFAALARELPDAGWQTVRVNPKDAALARKMFPGAELVPDEKITGGMDVSAGAGTVRVVNTFEKRLERAWGDLQPELIRDAYDEVNGEGASATTRGPGLSGRIPADEDQRQTVPPDL